MDELEAGPPFTELVYRLRDSYGADTFDALVNLLIEDTIRALIEFVRRMSWLTKRSWSLPQAPETSAGRIVGSGRGIHASLLLFL